MKVLTVAEAGFVCGYRFASGRNLCLAKADHPVHNGLWHNPPFKPEDNHDFEPLERRSGARDRRQEEPA
jgi:hypothetical protein